MAKKSPDCKNVWKFMMFPVIVLVGLMQQSEAAPPCNPPTTVLHNNGADSRCCKPLSCSPGTEPNICNNSDEAAFCSECPGDKYNDKILSSAPGIMEFCQPFTSCEEKYQHEVRPGNATHNRECDCNDPNYKLIARKCLLSCLPGLYLPQNTGLCVNCSDGTYKSNRGNEGCSKCTTCNRTLTECSATRDTECAPDVVQSKNDTSEKAVPGWGIFLLCLLAVTVIAGIVLCIGRWKHGRWFWCRSSHTSSMSSPVSDGGGLTTTSSFSPDGRSSPNGVVPVNGASTASHQTTRTSSTPDEREPGEGDLLLDDPADQRADDAVEPNAQSGQPVGDAAMPTAQSGQPVGDAAVPSAQSGQPVGDAAVPTAKSGQPIGDATVPTAQSGQPVGDAAVPTAQSSQLVGDAAVPTAQSGQPAGDAAVPTAQSGQPVGDPAVPNAHLGPPANHLTESKALLSQPESGLLSANFGQGSGDGGRTGAVSTGGRVTDPKGVDLQLRRGRAPDSSLCSRTGSSAYPLPSRDVHHPVDSGMMPSGQRTPEETSIVALRSDHEQPGPPADEPAAESIMQRYQRIIRENYNHVQDVFHPDSHFTGSLFSDRVLTQAEMNDIRLMLKQPGGRAEALGLVLDALNRKGDMAADPFIKALVDRGSRQDNLAKLIDPVRAQQLIEARDNPVDDDTDESDGKAHKSAQKLNSIRDDLDYGKFNKSSSSENASVKVALGTTPDPNETPLKGLGTTPDPNETPLKGFEIAPDPNETPLKGLGIASDPNETPLKGLETAPDPSETPLKGLETSDVSETPQDIARENSGDTAGPWVDPAATFSKS